MLFRGNSVATKALDYFMKLIGLRYLDRTIGQNIKDIYESKKSCEVRALLGTEVNFAD